MTGSPTLGIASGDGCPRSRPLRPVACRSGSQPDYSDAMADAVGIDEGGRFVWADRQHHAKVYLTARAVDLAERISGIDAQLDSWDERERREAEGDMRAIGVIGAWSAGRMAAREEREGERQSLLTDRGDLVRELKVLVDG